MICSLKSSMAVLAAALAFAGSSASAVAAEFHASTEHPTISITQTTPHQFTAWNGSKFNPIFCSTVKGSATWASTSTSTTLSFQPVYEGCKDSPWGRTVHVSMNGCGYSLTATEGSGSTYTGQMGIECPEGKSITTVITSTVNCVISIPPQTGLGVVHYETNGKDVQATFQIEEKLKVTVSAGGLFNCAVPIGEYPWGWTMTGALTVTAANTAEEPQLLSIY